MELLKQAVRVLREGTESERALLANAIEAEWAESPLIERARELHQDEDTEIDDNASTSEADGGTWVQAWVWVPNDEESDDDDG